jgi:hypothetical protein
MLENYRKEVPVVERVYGTVKEVYSRSLIAIDRVGV